MTENCRASGVVQKAGEHFQKWPANKTSERVVGTKTGGKSVVRTGCKDDAGHVVKLEHPDSPSGLHTSPFLGVASLFCQSPASFAGRLYNCLS